MAKNQLLLNVARSLLLLHFVLLIALSAKGSSITHNKPYTIRVFVSSSMLISLLKSYAGEAKKYNATLVFKGLPKGSFKELSKLILSMKDEGTREDELRSIQIDDEAFDRFNVTSVPSIVLSHESECETPAACKLTYDKIDGAIDIETALEKFARIGDMRETAAEILKQVGNEDIK